MSDYEQHVAKVGKTILASCSWTSPSPSHMMSEKLRKTKPYFDNILEITRKVHMTFDDYLTEIKRLSKWT